MDISNLKIKIEYQDADKAKKSLGELGEAGKKAENNVVRLGNSSKDAGAKVTVLARALEAAKLALLNMGKLLAGLVAGFAALGIAGLASTVKVSDEMRLLQGKIRNVLDDASKFPAVWNEIIAVSNRTGVAIDGVAQAFVRIAPAAERIGVTEKQLLKFNETFLKMGQISGAEVTELKNTMIQLSQAIASGTLRGDELRSVMEQMGTVGPLIAKSMGIPFETFKKAAEEGKITAQEVFKAILNESENVDKQFNKLPVAVSRAFNVVKNELALAATKLNDYLHINETLVKIINVVAGALGNFNKFLDDNKAAFDALNEIMGLAWQSLVDIFTTIAEGISPITEFIGKLITTGQTMSIGQQVAIVFARAVAFLAIAFNVVNAAVGDAIITIKEFLTLAPAVAGGAAAGAVGGFAVGGPIGAAIGATALGVGAYSNAKSEKAGELKALADARAKQEGDFKRRNKAIQGALARFELGVVNAGKNGSIPGLKDSPLNLKPPFAQPGKDKKGKKSKADRDTERTAEFISDLNAESAALQKLLEAQKQGAKAYQEMEDRIEAEKKVREAKLKLSESEKKALEDQIVKNKELKRTIDDVGYANKLALEAGDAQKLLDAVKKGGEVALQKAKDELEITKALRDRNLDETTDIGKSIAKAIRDKQSADRKVAVALAAQKQQDEIKDQESLAEALKDGTAAYRDRLAVIEAINSAKSKVGGNTKNRRYMRILAEEYKKIKQEAENSFNESFTKNTESLQRQIEMTKQLTSALGLNNEEYRAYEETLRAVNDAKSQGVTLSDKEVQNLYTLNKALADAQKEYDKTKEKIDQVKSAGESMGDALYQTFEDMIFGAKSFKDALIELLQQLSKIILNATLGGFLRTAGGKLGSALGGSLFGGGGAGSILQFPIGIASASGNVFNNGNVVPFAKGGIVGGPTIFNLKNQKGLMGESGPEAIVPLQRMANGSLGIASAGGAGEGGTVVTYQNNVSITVESGAGGSEQDRSELSKKIAKDVKRELSSIVDDRLAQHQRNGGMLNRGASLIRG